MYLKSNVLLLADVFESFRKTVLEIYELDPAKFISTPSLVWQTALKKTQVKLDLITDIDMLWIIEKGIRGGTCNAVNHYPEANNKYMPDYDENKQSSYLNYWEVNNFYCWEMSQKLPTCNFEWVEYISQFNEVFIKNYYENIEEGYILEVNVKYPADIYLYICMYIYNIYTNSIETYHFYQKERDWKKSKSL